MLGVRKVHTLHKFSAVLLLLIRNLMIQHVSKQFSKCEKLLHISELFEVGVCCDMQCNPIFKLVFLKVKFMDHLTC